VIYGRILKGRTGFFKVNNTFAPSLVGSRGFYASVFALGFGFMFFSFQKIKQFWRGFVQESAEQFPERGASLRTKRT
jgi:hypothetical protein